MAKERSPFELIEEAAKEGFSSLDLSGKQLIAIPPELTNLKQLTFLDLGNNQLTSLPPEIANLTNLQFLRISFNQLAELPLGITNLPNLIDLNLIANQLTSIRPEISRLTSLKHLSLNANNLTELPPQISELKNLKVLYLGNNDLTDFPNEIFELTSLTDLEVDTCGLSTLPVDVWKLINLERLSLRGNRLTSVPAEIAQIAGLKYLDLSGNLIKSLPPDLVKLPELAHIDLTGNVLPIPPETLSNPADVKAIFAALTGLPSGARLNEAKMLVVGDGKVGKSSVVERLIYDTFNPKKQTTLGVDINDEMQVIHSEVRGASEPIKLNIWDFGGQEIQHSTHQFFLTTRSLYLLVVDARKGDQIGNIEYWLKLIESFGGDSPIIIVINQIDQLKGQRELNLDRNALRAKYKIQDFVPISCETGQGIPDLRKAVSREVDNMRHVHDLWPPEWIAIKKRLTDMKKDYIPVETFDEICIGEQLHDPDLRESLLGLLHDLGVVIRFPGDTQVLNPRWVTQGVYGLLTSAQLVKSLGQFDLKDVGKILGALPETRERYPPHTHQRLVGVMKHFELCFEFIDRPDHYLIPRHLHDDELDIPWADSDALKFEYHYVETLPDSIISRFIVRMNQYIQKQYYWKNGVFLQNGDNRAKVKADLVDRKIFISIVGKPQTRRSFLAVIRSTFDEINKNFKIEIREMIPVPGFPDELVSYNDLLGHEEMNESEIVISKLKRKFSVRELLDGVEDLSIRMERRERDFHVKRIHQPPKESLSLPDLHQDNSRPQEGKPSSLMFFVFGFVILLAAIVGAAIAVSRWVSITAGLMTGIIIIGALLAIGVVGAMDLRSRGVLSDETFLELMIESYKRMPLLRGKAEDESASK